MNKVQLWLTLVFSVLMLQPPSLFAQTSEANEIIQLMREEEQAWNSGDIEAYVNLYAAEDSVRMIYSTGAVYGKENILAFYKKYWPKERMGTLVLDGERMERLSKKYYYVTGYFHVSYPDGKAINGRFSGLMKKIKGKWYLYTDHAG